MKSRITLTIIALSGVLASAQDSVRDELFGSLDADMDRAVKAEAGLLSPSHFQEADRAYRKAQDDYRRGRKLETIRESIAEAQAAVGKAMEVVELARTALKDTLALRQEVMQFRRLATKSDFWKAQDQLRKAGEKMERDDLKGARKHAADAEKRFRKAAIGFLKDDLLHEAKRALKGARKTFPADEYKAAERQLKDIEKRIKKLKDSQPFSIGEVVGGIRDEMSSLIPGLSPPQ